MCACRVEGMQPTGASHSPMLGELEDYLHEIRGREVNVSEDSDAGDVYSQLAQKEKDLLLAAEIGKELLERNSDLSRQNERLTEEYSRKLEVSLPFENVLCHDGMCLVIRFVLITPVLFQRSCL